MPSLQDITCDDVKTKYVWLVEYALQYFNTSKIGLLKAMGHSEASGIGW